MVNKPIKISDNCWKHTNEYNNFYYRKTSDPESDLHREDGPAVEVVNGNKFWYINNKLHRKDGPALELTNGVKHWYTNGKRHRKDGAASEYANSEYANGDKEWFYHGKHIDVSSQEEFEIHLKNLIFI